MEQQNLRTVIPVSVRFYFTLGEDEAKLQTILNRFVISWIAMFTDG